MRSSFLITLEARNPLQNVRRNYEVAAGRDLFGEWLVEVSFGRIGLRGRTIRHSFGDEADARRFAHDCLRQRRGAPRRIGVPYVVKCTDDGLGWFGNQDAVPGNTLNPSIL